MDSMSSVCYYCESKPADNRRHGKPACSGCHRAKIRAIVPPGELSEEEEAFRLKLMLSTFRRAFEEE
jgi:hypothetical protein